MLDYVLETGITLNKIVLSKSTDGGANYSTIETLNNSNDFAPFVVTEVKDTTIIYRLQYYNSTTTPDTLLQTQYKQIKVVDNFKPSLINPYFDPTILTKNTQTSTQLKADTINATAPNTLKYIITTIPAGLSIVRADNSAITAGTTEIPISEQIKITTPNTDADYTIKFKLKEYNALEGNEQSVAVSSRGVVKDTDSIKTEPIKINQISLGSAVPLSTSDFDISKLVQVDTTADTITPIPTVAKDLDALIKSNPSNIYQLQGINRHNHFDITQQSGQNAFKQVALKYYTKTRSQDYSAYLEYFFTSNNIGLTLNGNASFVTEGDRTFLRTEVDGRAWNENISIPQGTAFCFGFWYRYHSGNSWIISLDSSSTTIIHIGSWSPTYNGFSINASKFLHSHADNAYDKYDNIVDGNWHYFFFNITGTHVSSWLDDMGDSDAIVNNYSVVVNAISRIYFNSYVNGKTSTSCKADYDSFVLFKGRTLNENERNQLKSDKLLTTLNPIPQPPQIKSIKYGFGQGGDTMNNNDYDASSNPQGLQNSPSTTRGSIQKIRVQIEADYDLEPTTQVEIIPYREV